MKEKMNKIIKMMEQNPVVVDDHCPRELQLTGLVEFNNPWKGLGCCLDYHHFCLNECYISEEDGKLHLSMASNGGVLYGITQKAIDKFNAITIQDGGKIKCIHLPDGTKVFPSK